VNDGDLVIKISVGFFFNCLLDNQIYPTENQYGRYFSRYILQLGGWRLQAKI